MTTEWNLPGPIEAYVQAVNAPDADAFQSSFSADAVVKDLGHEIRGIAAINDWARLEVFDVNVKLDVKQAFERDGETIVTVKVAGTFDRTGLPDPLLMEHCFTVAGDKITSLSCRFTEEETHGNPPLQT